MNDEELKSYFHHYLQRGRDAVVWKLEGLSEYDVRRPPVGTGTNLLGLVKHLTYGIPTCPTSLRTSGRRTASGSRRLLWDFGKARVVHLEQRRVVGVLPSGPIGDDRVVLCGEPALNAGPRGQRTLGWRGRRPPRPPRLRCRP